MTQINHDEKKFAAKLSILSNSSLIVLKLFAGVVSGSIGIISEAIHSGSDLFASIVTFLSINQSSKPADNDHQFGHGKYEDFAGLIEGVLIILASFYIIYEAAIKILFPSLEHINVDLGLVVMLISCVANFFVSKYLFKIAKKTDSIALYADGEHLRTDIYSSLAVFLGLLAVKLTGNPIFDPMIAIAVAVIIFNAGFKICETSKNSLLDTSLSEYENSQIEYIISGFIGEGIIKLKSLRTRKAGMKKNIEMVLIIDGTMHVSKAHELCDQIEEKIDKCLHNTDISIHMEPKQ